MNAVSTGEEIKIRKSATPIKTDDSYTDRPTYRLQRIF